MPAKQIKYMSSLVLLVLVRLVLASADMVPFVVVMVLDNGVLALPYRLCRQTVGT